MKYIDISVPVSPATPTWPGDPSVTISRFIDMDRGGAVNASALSMSVHTGTHVDAPLHHFRDGASTATLDLDALNGRVEVIDCGDADVVDAALLESACAAAVSLERVLLKTRNSRLWRSAAAFSERYTYLTGDGAAWLAARGTRLVGIDYLSVEAFAATVPVAHRALLGAGVIILEGVNLDALSAGPYRLWCLPILIDADGAPARALVSPLEVHS